MRPDSIRIGLQQRILPAYRSDFFEELAESFPRGLGVFSGEPRRGEAAGVMAELVHPRSFPVRNIHLINSPFYSYWQAGLQKALKNWDPDVLILETNPRNLSNPFAARCMHNRRRPVIGWGLGLSLLQHKLKERGNILRKWLLGQFDAIITYSQLGASQLKEIGYPTERTFVAPNALTRRPQTPPPDRSPSLINHQASLLFVGRLQTRKRVDLLIKACAELPAHSQPRLMIVGEGPARAELENLAQEIYPRTEFCGYRFGKELDALFVSADLFILPGTGGLAVQQAMSHALPVIVGKADGSQGNLVFQENGWLLPTEEANQLKDIILEALTDIPRLRQMGIQSYRIVREEVNIEKMIEVFTRAILEVCED